MRSLAPLPDSFVHTITETFAPHGAPWLQNLPNLIAQCEERFSLRVTSPFTLSYNYVTAATQADGREVVLKLGVPNKELTSEIEALRLCNGEGLVKLIHGEPDNGVLLMERVLPGQMLSDVITDDAEATRIAAGVMRQMWRPVTDETPFHPLERWTGSIAEIRQEFEGGTGPYPSYLVEMAERIFAENLASMQERVLLHGDLHHFNILSANADATTWQIIDPKGLVGERGYEIAQFMLNPRHELAIDPAIQRHRLAIFADELGLDRQRITRWAAAHAILSSWWDYSPTSDSWQQGVATAEVLAGLL